MGLFDVLSGRRKLAKPAPDRLFAMTTAYVTMQSTGQLTSRGSAAIVFQSLATADFQSIVRDMEEVVRATAQDSGTTVATSEDAYGFSWMIVSDNEFDDLVVAINAVSTALTEGGYGERVLCAVFALRRHDRGATAPRCTGSTTTSAGRSTPFAPAERRPPRAHPGQRARTRAASSGCRVRCPIEDPT